MLFPALSRNECLIPRAQTSLVMTKSGAIVSRVIAVEGYCLQQHDEK